MAHGNVASIRELSRALASAVTPEVVLGLQQEVRELRAEKFALARAAKRAEIAPRIQAAVLAWLMRDAEDLVFDDGQAAVRVWEGFELPEQHGDLVSRYIVATLSGDASIPSILRNICRVCRETRCTSHGEESVALVIPAKVQALMSEVRRG